MSISTTREVSTDHKPVLQPGPLTAPAAARPASAMFRLRSVQPSRRAVVHLQAAGDPVVPAGLATWFTERSCHFYLSGLRLPTRSVWPFRWDGRAEERVFGELDAVCAHLRDADGIEHVIVSAQGPAAVLAARWCDRRARARAAADGLRETCRPAADALILYQPAWSPSSRVRLDIDCPVLVLSGSAPRPRRLAASVRLGGHVTWLQLPEYAGLASAAGLAGVAGGPASRAFFAELGRWLGAYMYGHPIDKLL